MHEADTVVHAVRAAEPCIARTVSAGSREVGQPVRVPYEARLGQGRAKQCAGAASGPHHRRKPALLDRRLRDRDDGVAPGARAHRHDALDKPVERGEAVIGVLLAGALGEHGAQRHVLVQEEHRDMESRIPPMNRVPCFGRAVVEDALPLLDALGEKGERLENRMGVPIRPQGNDMRQAGKLGLLRVDDEHLRTVFVRPGKESLDQQGDDARRLPASGLSGHQHGAGGAKVYIGAVLDSKLVGAWRRHLFDAARLNLMVKRHILDKERHVVARHVGFRENDRIAREPTAKSCADALRELRHLVNGRRQGGD